ncbi:hypothetical protein [Rhizobium sp. LC145]|uniref:hypothetical protein n=1 Tax=Rhizobium sp. LC145 TaxID=1120688 RepID=UPI00062A03EF|nr:hypothetical protein [Rhizobium sp. LC145]KKX29612.1 transmembrane protein [Rhizobium sp. LC145]MDX3927988.1 hypothetical protein [Shinella sp.]TKT66176.1 hypothetical protein FDR95_06770 [Rhizobiaceae bacterium LC148]
MKRLFLVAALPLLASGCASTLPEVVASTDSPDTMSDVRPVLYQSPIGGYSHRMPVDPKPWRGLNDAQAPKKGGA